ncbi:TraB/GumN family protein [Dysgonomonas sp. 521]|uniref:TraB/GumN family protein n=1 Tax=Dysgonomonas sp. 521 TaxID=2302932 RepID=UPI0013D03B57|nr:TraB/GumN family protein [Dysgonomonas sp. 521]NDV94402.1 TraB/GumN family protein [Dysgonomonas sp. 521]
MKNLITTFAAIVLFVVTSTLAAQNETKYNNALLWKVSGNGLSQPSYILGTHHLVHLSFVDSIPGLKEAMETTGQTVGELLMSDQAAMQVKLQQAAMMPAGESYDKLLSAEDYAKLDEGLIKLFTVGLGQLGQMKPGMISMLYTITTYTKLYPEFNPMAHEAIDAYVQRIATEKGKATLGLETADDQIYALFDAEPLKDQAESLVCSVVNNDTAKDLLDKLNTYYRAGQLNNMYNLAFNNPDDPCKVSKEQQNVLNKDRNDKWLEKLPQIMADKSSLIAVGALHLAGEEGLLAQLAAKGYTVEAVK